MTRTPRLPCEPLVSVSEHDPRQVTAHAIGMAYRAQDLAAIDRLVDQLVVLRHEAGQTVSEQPAGVDLAQPAAEQLLPEFVDDHSNASLIVEAFSNRLAQLMRFAHGRHREFGDNENLVRSREHIEGPFLPGSWQVENHVLERVGDDAQHIRHKLAVDVGSLRRRSRSGQDRKSGCVPGQHDFQQPLVEAARVAGDGSASNSG